MCFSSHPVPVPAVVVNWHLYPGRPPKSCRASQKGHGTHLAVSTDQSSSIPGSFKGDRDIDIDVDSCFWVALMKN